MQSFRERLNKVVRAGEIASADPWSITLEIPSGPLAVLTLCVERSLWTSLWEQVMLDSTGFGWGRCETLGTSLELVKHEVKKLSNKLAFSVGEFASVPLWKTLISRSSTVFWVEFVVLHPEIPECADVVYETVEINFLGRSEFASVVQSPWLIAEG